MNQQLAPHQQQELLKDMEQGQLKESLALYNRVVDKCVKECVTSFKSKKLDSYETSCVDNCSSKFFSTTARVGQRFAEIQAMKQQQQQS
ncbi:hypothetical protein TrCOL_g9279 [Triparma columacea]|uniref:Mitochondrial import inner membrane translocase subunit n=1 Tax=Triparma columacea TaxID=722753 RepID=A0A9W7GKR8_9STRA|nr:hypothetical protein TrCOL_g9279 [Triparma columacea]